MKDLLARTGWDRRQVDVYAVLLSAPVLLTLYRYRGSANRFPDWFPSLAGHPLSGLFAVLFQWAAFFLLLFLVPALFAFLRMHRPLRELGFGPGDRRAGILLVAFALPLLVAPLALLASKMPVVRAEYPLARILLSRPDLVLWYESAYILLYYLAWEFYFRGFLLFSLEGVLGGMNAVLIQTISSCLVHIGKPEGEIMGSIIAGLVLGVIALRTRSFWYGWVLHAGLGVLVDLSILFS